MDQNRPVIIIGRLLRIERQSRELAELVADQANHANDGTTPDERTGKITAVWNDILRHVRVVENQLQPPRAPVPTMPHRQNGRN